MPLSFDNPFAPPSVMPSDPDLVAFAKNSLGPKDAAEIAALLEPKNQASQTEEDWDEQGELALSPEERKKIENDKVFQEIIMREKLALSNFFEKNIDVPPLPKEITRAELERWRLIGFEPHYLPSEDLFDITRDGTGELTGISPKNFAAWKKKPCDWFLEQIEAKILSPDTARLSAGWVWVDTRQKPEIEQNNRQMYKDDPLAPALERLREANIIGHIAIKGSRFNLSPEELVRPDVIAAFAAALGTSPQYICVQSAIEFNILGNIHYPKWGKTNTSEWFNGRSTGSKYLLGGDSASGGLSYINGAFPTFRRSSIGFRLIVRFPAS